MCSVTAFPVSCFKNVLLFDVPNVLPAKGEEEFFLPSTSLALSVAALAEVAFVLVAIVSSFDCSIGFSSNAAGFPDCNDALLIVSSVFICDILAMPQIMMIVWQVVN